MYVCCPSNLQLLNVLVTFGILPGKLDVETTRGIFTGGLSTVCSSTFRSVEDAADVLSKDADSTNTSKLNNIHQTLVSPSFTIFLSIHITPKLNIADNV
jgi:hypothetical protein